MNIELVEEVGRNIHAKSSTRQYINNNIKLIVWLYDNGMVEFLKDEVTSAFDQLNLEEARAFLLNMLRNRKPVCSFTEDFTPDLFISFLGTLKNRQGLPVTKGTLGNYRSALMDLFRINGFNIDPTWRADLSIKLRGLKRMNVNVLNSTSTIRPGSGKEPIPIDVYRKYNIELLKRGGKEDIFAKFFGILAWNLMSRSVNICKIRFNEFFWTDDALKIVFVQMKNDQLGDRAYPRHIYANPIEPHICPILGMGLYFLTLSFIDQDGYALFDGNKQYNRFRERLVEIFKWPEIQSQITISGMDINDLGTHSFRKGALSFSASGSTTGPPSHALRIRAGWTGVGVDHLYIRYEAAGDQVVGRLAAGLDINSTDFISLPPRFDMPSQLQATKVKQTVKEVFPGLPEVLLGAAIHGLASILYHEEFLKQNVPASSPIFMNPLFLNTQLKEKVKDMLISGPKKGSSDISPSGVPPHVLLLKKLDELKRKTEGLTNKASAVEERLNSLGKEVTNDLQQFLSEQEFNSQPFGIATLQQAISCLSDKIERLRHAEKGPVFEDTGEQHDVSSINSSMPVQEPTTTVTEEMPSNWPFLNPSLISTFQFPKCTSLSLWQMYHFGNQHLNHGPYRFLRAQLWEKDDPRRDPCHRMHNLIRFYESLLEAIYKHEGRHSTFSFTKLKDVETGYQKIVAFINLPTYTPKGTKRRKGTLQWNTEERLWRQNSELKVRKQQLMEAVNTILNA